MLIQEIHVRNFRCIKDATLTCEKLTVLVGPNGAGKSTFLHALNLFYPLGARYTEEDFHDSNCDEPILIAVTFKELTIQERELFAPYLDGEKLTVEKELSFPPGRGSEKYYGSRLRYPGFREIRNISAAREKRAAYDQLRNIQNDLPPVTRADDIESRLSEWESQHPDKLQRIRDEGQFFGFREVGNSHLEQFTLFFPVPAVREASVDASEDRGSALRDLMDLVVRSTLSQREDLKRFQEEFQGRYNGIMSRDSLTELDALQADLTKTLKTYVPDASVRLDWLPTAALEVPLPAADVKLVEDGYVASVNRTGHGLQRAFILTMLQQLTLAQAQPRPIIPDDVEAQQTSDALSGCFPSLILCIEEPELYQHPSRQRHLADILLRLSESGIEGVTENVQVLYSTHSPLFVDLERFDSVRVLRKEVVDQGLPRQTQVHYTSLDAIAKLLQSAQDDPDKMEFTGDTLKTRLATIMTPHMNEGFFADVVVLVEGECDRAAILGNALAKEINFDALGISVIHCPGKNGLDRPYAVFSNLDLPTYLLWDSDYIEEDEGENAVKKARANRSLLRLVGEQPEDWPERLQATFACFKTKLETKIRTEIGEELFDELLTKYRTELGLAKREDAVKNPRVIAAVLAEARVQGRVS